MGECAKQRKDTNNDDKKQNDQPKGQIGETVKKPIRHFRDLDVYQNAFEIGLRVYELSKKFSDDERYALTDQVRRSSRSVCANIAEAWRQAALHRSVHFQAKRFRKRGRGNATAHQVCISSRLHKSRRFPSNR
jgi:hypothetical protein